MSEVSATVPIQRDVARFVEDLKRRLEGARLSAARAANREPPAEKLGFFSFVVCHSDAARHANRQEITAHFHQLAARAMFLREFTGYR